ncbi:MAG TPA: hypothetical protein DDX71_07870 [Ruminococcus sp.]|nr:hypothetical protein [Ruminococcus sp.]
MKKIQSLVSVSAAIVTVLAAVPMTAAAADDTVYGTMNIPYTDFYAAELGENAYAVDAVTSATKNKVLMNEPGKLFEGTYNNGEDTILGVTYAVAISQADLDALGDNNYGFTKLDETPAVYKNVTVADGKASFSAVQDASPETASVGVKLSTETPWGDYLIDFTDRPEDFDTVYSGAILKTADGKAYAMRHEQNIWRGEIAWSSGIKTTEPHGNVLDWEAYKGLMGSTVNEIVLITKNGYVTVTTDTYIPVKFANTVTVEEGKAGTGKTSFTEEGFPTDYQKTYAVADGFTAASGEISYTNAKPGNYTLTISDAGKKYADVITNFLLTTTDLPVQYKEGKLVAAEGFTDEQAAAFIKNIATVQVGETNYNASGKRSTKIVGEDGTIDFAVKSGENAIFADGENGAYTITVSATGYTNPLVINTAAAETTAAAVTTTSAKATTTTKATTKATTATKATTKAAGATTTAGATKTGDAGVSMAVAGLLLAGAAAVAAKKKH